MPGSGERVVGYRNGSASECEWDDRAQFVEVRSLSIHGEHGTWACLI
jgi:hypothetical protein